MFFIGSSPRPTDLGGRVFPILTIALSVSLSRFSIKPTAEEMERRITQPVAPSVGLEELLGVRVPGATPRSSQGEPMAKPARGGTLLSKFIAMLHTAIPETGDTSHFP